MKGISRKVGFGGATSAIASTEASAISSTSAVSAVGSCGIATPASSAAPTSACGTGLAGLAIELVVSSDGARPSMPELDVQPAMPRHAKREATMAVERIWTRTQNR